MGYDYDNSTIVAHYAANRKDADEIEDFIRSFQDQSTFRDKLFTRMQALGFAGDFENLDETKKFLLRCFADAHIDDVVNNTILNWLKTGRPSTSDTGKQNIYKLCFALKMGVEDTSVFFHQAVLDHPFNYKNLFEAACYFCMNTGRPYSRVKFLIDEIVKLPKNPSQDTIQTTARVGENISRITSEAEFIGYWLAHCSGFEAQKVTATREATKLLNRCYEVANEYCDILRIRGNDAAPKRVNNPDKLLQVIYGYPARSTELGKRIFKLSISKSDFPDPIKRNFPQRQQFENISSGSASYEVLRKAIIVLHFFHYFAEKAVRQIPLYGQKACDDYEANLNRLLDSCGYARIYYRNPFDWLFYHCASVIKYNSSPQAPLDELQNIISTFYLDKALG